MVLLLKSNSNTKEDLFFIRIILKRYVRLIKYKLNEYFGKELNNYYNPKNQNIIKNVEISKDINQSNNKNKIIIANSNIIHDYSDKSAASKISDISDESAAIDALTDETYFKKKKINKKSKKDKKEKQIKKNKKEEIKKKETK